MDCSKIDFYIEPLFENRLSLIESNNLKEHFLICPECYSKLNDEQKISLEIYKTPSVPIEINVQDIFDKIKKQNAFNIIPYKKTSRQEKVYLFRIALYILFILCSVFLLNYSRDRQVNSNISQNLTVSQRYNNPNIKRIKKIEVINEVLPYYKESNLLQHVSAETSF